MGMQTDVRAVHTTASTAIFDNRTRLRAVTIAVSVAGTDVTFFDNPTVGSGDVLLRVSTTAVGYVHVLLPGEGVLAQTGVFCTITGGTVGVTAVYG